MLFLNKTTPVTATLDLSGQFTTLSFLTLPAGSPSVNFTLHFSDTTTTTGSFFAGNDWGGGGSPILSAGILNSDLTTYLTGAWGAMYQANYTLAAGDQTKTLQSISFTQSSGDKVGVLAISGNGMLTSPVSNYAGWAADPAHTLTGGPTAVGNDGLTNLLVYALDLKTDGTNGSPGTLTGKVLSFAKRADAVTNNDVTYAIEVSSDLGLNDSWTITTTGVTDNPTTISIDLSTLGGSTHFARLVVTQK